MVLLDDLVKLYARTNLADIFQEVNTTPRYPR